MRIEAIDQEYLQRRYHTALEEITTDWDLRGADQDIELYFAISRAVAGGAAESPSTEAAD